MTQWDSPQDFYVFLNGGEVWQRVGFAPDELNREARVCVKFEVSDDMVHESRASYYYGEPCVSISRRKSGFDWRDDMTQVLWFSRHEMTAEQLEALKGVCGEVCINQINRTIKSAYELADEIAAADVVAIVAPINLQVQFLRLAGDKPVIYAVNRRTFNENGKLAFNFERWEQIDKIEVVTHKFA